MRLESRVEQDEFTEHASKCFDLPFDGTTYFDAWEKPSVPDEFTIGLIHGPSGSGKSTLLGEFGVEEKPEWSTTRAVVSHFATPEDAVERLTAVGFNSIPSWMRPYHCLSTGEQFRADLARKLNHNVVIDEFTSVVNRDVAKSASVAVSRYIKEKGFKNVVFATCHEDIKEWLNPEWSFDTSDGSYSIGRWLQRPSIRLKIYRGGLRKWETFAHHHYLNKTVNKASHCYLLYWGETLVGFNATLYLPGRIPPLYDGDDRPTYRASRTVVLPDFQGLGIGVRFSDALGQLYLDQGLRFFSKTAHFRFGEYRQKADWWRATSTNLKDRSKSRGKKSGKWDHWHVDQKRICYSHEYIGKRGNKYRELYEEALIKKTKKNKESSFLYEKTFDL